jgi:hypothetical protein
MTKPKAKPKVDSWMVIAKSLERLTDLSANADHRLRHLEQVQLNICGQCGEFLQWLAKIQAQIEARGNKQDEQLDRFIELLRQHVQDVDQLARMVTEKSIRRDLKTPLLREADTLKDERAGVFEGWR